MRGWIPGLAVVLGLGVIAGSNPAILLGQEKGGDDYTGPYNVVAKWPLPSRLARPGRIFGSTSGIWAETPNKVYVSVRGEIILPETVNGRKVPPNFTGAFGALGMQATSQVPDLTLNGGVLAIQRDYETPGGSGTLFLTFNRVS